MTSYQDCDANSVATGTEEIQCMCAMCNCGKHHCPVHRQRVPFEGKSTALDAYREWPLEKPSPSLARTQREAVPFEGNTRYREDYPGWQPESRTDGRRPVPERARIPFEGESTSKMAYKEWPLEARSPAARPAARTSVPFEGSTESRTAFASPGPDAYARAAGPGARQDRPRIPFEGETTSAVSYKEWPLEARQSQPNKLRSALPDDRDFRTESGREYTPKYVDVCPVTRLPPPPMREEHPGAWEGDHVLFDRRRGEWMN